ncbi:SDR family oxidoreductase [Sphingopyxis sp.]|uniref:SDR family oxidoreductase n=1 Tax=Sphingopyxis sp. TaxID=1908224 RepID=UPI003D6D3854
MPTKDGGRHGKQNLVHHRHFARIGFALAKAALARGNQVIGTTRDGSAPECLPADRLAVLALDVTDLDAAAPVVLAAHALHGRLDVIVNHAG